MKTIHKYKFYKTKYGEELLIDIVSLDSIKHYLNKHPVHVLSYFDITFITNDYVNFSIDNKQYTLCAGDVIFSKPNQVRAWDKNNLPHGYALIFEEDFLLSFFNDCSFIQNLSYFSRERTAAKINITDIYPRIESLIQSITTEINNEEPKDKHILRALLYEMLMLLNREYSKNNPIISKKNQSRYINDFISLVDKDFKFHHDTKYYANQLCISPNYLNEIVQKNIGINPKCYIQNKIIQEAKILLSYSTLSVAEIADNLNIESPSCFIRLFRKQTNLTPLQYRQSTIR